MVRASSLWKGEPCEESVFSVRQNVICFCCVSVRGVNLGSLGLLSLVRLFRWHVTQGHGLAGNVFSVRPQRVFVPSCAVLFPSGFRLFGSVFEQAGAGILQQVEHQFETFPAFIVGVRNMVVVVPAAKIRHTVNFGFVFEGKGQAVEGVVVAFVHGNEHVETGEVFVENGTGPVREAITPPLGRFAHARVGQVAAVAGVSSR